MPMRLMLLVCVVVACAPHKPPSEPEPAPSSGSPAAAAPAGTALAPSPTATAAGRVGDACRPDFANPRSTCGAGQLCMPAPGGYCTGLCGATGAPCPAGSACYPSVRGGELCGRTCTSDTDCRVEEGYICDPGRKVCSLPFLAAPALARCAAPAPPDGDFGPAVALSTRAMPGVYQFEPAAALTPAGDLVVVYTSGGPLTGKSFLGVSRVPASGAPVIDQPLPTTKGNHFDAWATATRDGTVHAVWLGHDGGGRDLNAEIGYARSSDGGATWTTPVAVHTPADCPPGTPFCLDKPMIAAGPAPGARGKDAVHVLYAGGGEGMRMRTSLDGGATWGAPVTAAEGAYGDVTVDARGRIHVTVLLAEPRGAAAWGSPEGSVVYTVSSDGRTFGAPVTVSASGESIPFYFVNPTIAVDDVRGWLYIAYAAGSPDGRWDIQLAASRDGGKSWSRRKLNDDETCANHMVPNLALDPRDGSLHATFLENRGGAGHLAYTSCKPAGGACARVVRASPDMAAYELVRHSSKWLGEYQSLLVDPKRRVLHSVWTHTVQEGDAAIARVFHAARKLR